MGRGGGHKPATEVVVFLTEQRARAPRTRLADLAWLVEERFGLAVHPRGIGRALARHAKGGRSEQP